MTVKIDGGPVEDAVEAQAIPFTPSPLENELSSIYHLTGIRFEFRVLLPVAGNLHGKPPFFRVLFLELFHTQELPYTVQ
jgi:hypothetical protein